MKKLRLRWMQRWQLGFCAFSLLQLLIIASSYFGLVYFHQNRIVIGTFQLSTTSRFQHNYCIEPRTFEPYTKFSNPWDDAKTASVLKQVVGDAKERLSILHVAKEFGNASFGGIGTMVTQLANAQARSGYDVSVIIPYYQYLRNVDEDASMWKLSVPVQSRCLLGGLFRNGWTDVHFTVFRRRLDIGLDIYFVGTGDVFPFTRAFDAKDVFSIYYSDYWLDTELQDIFYNAAVARVISKFAELKSSRKAAIHLHGATTAPAIALYNRPTEDESVSVTYTLHDYSFEQKHSLLLNNLACFDERFQMRYETIDKSKIVAEYATKFRARSSFNQDRKLPVEDQVIGDRFYPFGSGIMISDSVTFVSDYLMRHIVSNALEFEWKEVLLGYLLYRARGKELYGISNGIDIHRLNPFTHSDLVERGLNFPLAQTVSSVLFDSSVGSRYTSVGDAKSASKVVLCEEFSLFKTNEACTRPLFAFIGRFSYDKGVVHVTRLVPRLPELNANFILMGQPNDYDMTQLYFLQSRYSDHFRIIDTDEEQKLLGTFVRAGADFLFLPTYSESFGLVAIEGLMFGSAIVSSGAGGLREFLVDRDTSSLYNAFLFDVNEVRKDDEPNPVSNEATLFHAVHVALQALRELSRVGKLDLFRNRLILAALKLGWDRTAALALDDEGEIVLNGEIDPSELSSVEKYAYVYLNE